MNDKHITNILDNTPLATLSETDLQAIRAHTASCADCERAFEAARISAVLLNERAEETTANALNANPFFQTRVLAAWRNSRRPPALGICVAFGARLTRLLARWLPRLAALAVLTFVIPATIDAALNKLALVLPASAETGDAGSSQYDDMTNEQVLSAIYDDEERGE